MPIGSDAVNIATNNILGRIEKEVEAFRRDVASVSGQLSRLAELQEQTIGALQQQTELLSEIRLHQQSR